MPYIPQKVVFGLGLPTGNTRPAISAYLQPGTPSQFSLEASGVLGLLGGNDAISAMASVHVYENRRWLGWYNNPGSFQIFSRLASFAKSTAWSSIADGASSTQDSSSSNTVHTDPVLLLGADGNCKGPKFRAAHSGTVMEETGYLTALFMKECATKACDRKEIRGRLTRSVEVTVVDLNQAPDSNIHPAGSSTSTLFFSAFSIAISLVTCVLCGVFRDWYAFSLILVGIIASGISSLVLGSADLIFSHPRPANGSPAGDGIIGSDKDIVLLRGSEDAVNSITRGTFSLRFANEVHHHLVRCCAHLFLAQAMVQLLVIRQASLFGQIMFLASLGTSALCNAALSSADKEKIYRKLLFERVLENPKVTTYTLGTRTTAVVFILLVLQQKDPEGLLNELLPNDTKVWRQWKEEVLARLRHPYNWSCGFGSDDGGHGFTPEMTAMLQVLYGDAQAAYVGYQNNFPVNFF